MCFGGGGGGGTIVQPNTGAYDMMANAQISAMQSAMQMGTQRVQAQLNDSLRMQGQYQQQLRDIQIERAENTQAQARRMAELIGPPPPEETAKAPGTNEKTNRNNKSRLRINRPRATSSAQGTGLNINLGG